MRSLRPLALLVPVASALLALAACAEQSDDSAPLNKPDTGLLEVGSDAPAVESGADAAPPDGASGGGGVVLNELRAVDGDYIELLNVSGKTVDLSGWTLSSLKQDDASTPNVYTFPAGTTLAAGEHFLVVGKDPAAGTELTTSCVDAAVSHCGHVTWGVSDKSGSLVTLALPDAAVSDLHLYPPGAAPSGSSFGRLPDGTGAFVATKPTPGLANEAP